MGFNSGFKGLISTLFHMSRSLWPRGLRPRSATSRLLGLRVRNQAGSWIFYVVSVVCCQVEVSAKGWPLVQRSPTDCGVCVCKCNLEASAMRRPRPSRAVELWKRKYCVCSMLFYSGVEECQLWRALSYSNTHCSTMIYSRKLHLRSLH